MAMAAQSPGKKRRGEGTALLTATDPAAAPVTRSRKSSKVFQSVSFESPSTLKFHYPNSQRRCNPCWLRRRSFNRLNLCQELTAIHLGICSAEGDTRNTV